jgi:amino acid transporter
VAADAAGTSEPPGAGGSPVRSAGFTARVGLLSILGLLYASACGGPYGTENYVAETGPGLLVLLLFAAPWLWGVPIALATAELTSARPIEGGYIRWAQQLFGDFWGFQAGAWTLTASFLDNALYPVLFAETLGYWLPGMSHLQRWAAAVLFIAIITYLNYRGIEIAGRAAVALTIFLMSPLVWIVASGFRHARYNPLVPFTAPGTDPWAGLGQGLTLAIWFYSGYTEVSSAAEEIQNPQRTIPLALLLVTPLVVLSYALPTLAGLTSLGGWQNWESGHFSKIGEALGGRILGHWAFLGSVASFSVIFMAYVLWYSRLAWAMAAQGHLPAYFTRLHPRYGTPYRTIAMYAAGYALLSFVRFDDLLVLDMWVFGAYDLLLCASVIKGRRLFADRPSGFRIPGGRLGVWLNFLVPALTWILALATTARTSLTDIKLPVWIPGTAALLLGPSIYLGIAIARKRRAAACVPGG